MAQAANGDTVRVHYTGKLVDGTVFDSSAERDPIEFKIGEGNLIPGFENAVVGLNPGESKSTTIPAVEAYGLRREEMVVMVERERFPKDLKPEVGQLLNMRQADGNSWRVKVTDVGESKVTLDANHPLAGKDLTFEIELVEIA